MGLAIEGEGEVSVDEELRAEVDFSRLACSSGRRDKPAMSARLSDEGAEVVLVSHKKKSILKKY